MMPPATDGPGHLLRLHVRLRDIEPSIWRRLEVWDGLCLDDLHLTLQATMGWEDAHLYEFRIGEQSYGMTGLLVEPEDGFPEDAFSVRLADLKLAPGDEILYLYDPGDGWEHEIRVEEVVTAGPDDPPVRCLAGARRAPPEDCGGPWGYREMLASLEDPDDPEHEEWWEWLGESYDPERVSPTVANATLAALFEAGGLAAAAGEGPGGEARDATKGAPPEPEVLERLDEILAHMEDASAGDPRITDEVFSAAADLLFHGVERFPGRLLRSRKLEGWAAGALHAAGVLVPFRGREERPTLEELSRTFDVSVGTADRRSLELRQAALQPLGPASVPGFAPDPAEARGGPGIDEEAPFPLDPATLLAGLVSELAVAANQAYDAYEEDYDASAHDFDAAPHEAAWDAGSLPPGARVEELLLGAEARWGRSADAFYREAADLLSARADEMDEDELRYLIRRGLAAESDEGFRRFLDLGLRHFGMDAAAWVPSGSGRRGPTGSDDEQEDPPTGGRPQLRLL